MLQTSGAQGPLASAATGLVCAVNVSGGQHPSAAAGAATVTARCECCSEDLQNVS